jgi:DNA-directed RNA polymerase subunit RPC12/RpoP
MFEEFQYYCVNCGAEFDTTNKTKNAYCCPNCDSNNIVNRKK